MTASKETARAAIRTLKTLFDSLEPEERNKRSASFIALHDFLEAAEKRLPTEASIERDKNRRKKK